MTRRAPEKAVRLRRTEKEEQRQCVQLLRLYSVAVYDTSQPFRAAITPGVPDLICFSEKHGLFFVEVKAGRGTQSIAQKVFESLCRRAGITYILGGVNAVADYLSPEKSRYATLQR